MKITSSIHNLWTRVIEYVKSDGIYKNGSDNLYPEHIRAAYDRSVTAKACGSTMAKFIYGQGFEQNPVVNPITGMTANDLLRIGAASIAEQGAFPVHVAYKPDRSKVLTPVDYLEIRIEKEDDADFPGMIVRRDTWGKETTKKGQRKYFPFTKDFKQVEAQLASYGSMEEAFSKYTGQVKIISIDPSRHYPLAYLDSVLMDADSEFRSAQVKNGNLRNGLLGKVIVHAVPSGDESKDRKLQADVKKLMGSENTGNMLYLTSDYDADGEVRELIKVSTVDPKIDDKTFSYTESSLKDNIMIAYNKVPKPLVTSSDGAMFGSSGEALREMKIFYQEQTEWERQVMEEAFTDLLGMEMRIIPLVTQTNNA